MTDEETSNPVPHVHHYVLKGSGLSCYAECDVGCYCGCGLPVCGEKLAGDNGPIVGSKAKVERAIEDAVPDDQMIEEEFPAPERWAADSLGELKLRIARAVHADTWTVERADDPEWHHRFRWWQCVAVADLAADALSGDEIGVELLVLRNAARLLVARASEAHTASEWGQILPPLISQLELSLGDSPDQVTASPVLISVTLPADVQELESKLDA